jgi:hypothetical protein
MTAPDSRNDARKLVRDLAARNPPGNRGRGGEVLSLSLRANGVLGQGNMKFRSRILFIGAGDERDGTTMGVNEIGRDHEAEARPAGTA